MSFFPGKDPAAGDRYACDALEVVVVPRSVDLGRIFGPPRAAACRAAAPSGRSCSSIISARRNSRAGMVSTCGRIRISVYRRSLISMTVKSSTATISGVKAAIHPGAVNWMTAGRGIVHSERTAPEHRRDGEPLHGLQFWVGMPSEKEEIDPSFAHLDGNDLPIVTGEGKTARIVAGSLFGVRSPLATTSETLVRRRFARGWRRDAARCRLRGARHLYRGGRDRCFRRQVRRRPASRVPPDRPDHR